ncbi:hypothetical protein GTU79_21905 [Sodalis ligni]|uniref:hypothetical protein n=1 Tax=Sodalis ligni TaxID=2697027 RepID=UPI001BDE9561|nr:hypothetical protein [Sodalis ligni]QWA09927.1 hypothetical protein GTU79_21905 [Sodalis ligni]
MSSYNKHNRSTLLTHANDEKKVMQALITAELNAHAINPEAHLNELKAGLATSKKHSSATLLRRKLKGGLVRELHEIKAD